MVSGSAGPEVGDGSPGGGALRAPHSCGLHCGHIARSSHGGGQLQRHAIKSRHGGHAKGRRGGTLRVRKPKKRRRGATAWPRALRAARCCRIARNGAMPVPGPTPLQRGADDRGRLMTRWLTDCRTSEPGGRGVDQSRRPSLPRFLVQEYKIFVLVCVLVCRRPETRPIPPGPSNLSQAFSVLTHSTSLGRPTIPRELMCVLISS